MPLISLSLEASRDCFEDYDYLYMIKEKISEKITQWNLSVTADDAMQPYYDGVIRDVCEYPARLYFNLMAVRNRIGEELSDGLDFVMTNTLRPNAGGYNAYLITLYSDPGTIITMADSPFIVENFSTYSKHTMYYVMNNDYYDTVKFCIEKDGIKKTLPHAFLRRKIDTFSRLIDLYADGIYDKLKAANPDADFEIIKKDGVATLKITFNKKLKRGQFIIPAECLITKDFSLYNYIRCNVVNMSDQKPFLQFTFTSSSASEFFSGIYYCESNNNILLDTSVDPVKLDSMDGEKLKDIRLSLSSDLSQPITICISDLFMCDMPGGYSSVMRIVAQNTEY